jgi:hypothetical protein
MRTPLAAALLLLALTAHAQGVPAHNAATFTEPPPRPAAGDADDKARRLFEAIQKDDPALAADFYFPRDAFLQVKAMADPGRYWDRLRKRFDSDIHALHAAHPELAKATFVRFELVKRGGWVKVGEEGNKLPYWVSRHSWLHYTVDGKPAKIEVRVLITWDDHWYITHLNEFH